MIVLIDHREHAAWTFQQLRSDPKAAKPYFDARTERAHMKTGDYTIKGMEDRVAIERKSCVDLAETVLGFKDGHRKRFEAELERMAQLECTAVVVEGTLETVLECVEDRGRQSATARRKTLTRSIINYMQRWPNVQWLFFGSRRAAEVFVFRYFDSFVTFTKRKDDMSNDFDDLFGPPAPPEPENPATRPPVMETPAATENPPAPPQENPTPPVTLQAGDGVEVHYAGLDEGIRLNSIDGIETALRAVDDLIAELHTTRLCLSNIQNNLAKSSDPPQEEVVDSTAPSENGQSLMDRLKGAKVKGLGRGKLEALHATFETVDAFTEAVRTARSVGKPDHANMPKGVGPDLVGNILEELQFTE